MVKPFPSNEYILKFPLLTGIARLSSISERFPSYFSISISLTTIVSFFFSQIENISLIAWLLPTLFGPTNKTISFLFNFNSVPSLNASIFSILIYILLYN